MKQQEIRLLACDEEVLNEADDILGDELAKLNRYSRYCYTPTEIGKSFGIEGRDLNSFLADRGVIRWSGGLVAGDSTGSTCIWNSLRNAIAMFMARTDAAS